MCNQFIYKYYFCKVLIAMWSLSYIAIGNEKEKT